MAATGRVTEVGAAKSTPPRGHAGTKVFVASKLPMSLEIFLEEFVESEQRFQGSVWVERVARQIPESPRVTLAGIGFPIGAPPEGTEWPERPVMAGGYALTLVDEEFIDKWFEAHAKDPMVKNRVIIKAKDLDDAKAMAKENKEVNSGLGPLERGKDKDGNPIITDRRKPRKVRSSAARRVEEAA